MVLGRSQVAEHPTHSRPGTRRKALADIVATRVATRALALASASPPF